MFETLVILAAAIAAILIYAVTRPGSFRIERAAVIKAPAEKIFALVNDFRQWEAWSPWEKIDPQIKRTYSGADLGRGAVYQWSGNKNIGSGQMEIIASSPERIVLKLDFSAPFEAHNTVEFTFLPRGSDTTVTQAMYGPCPYLSKLIGIFCSMDKMVGRKYEEGLANLKALAEK